MIIRSLLNRLRGNDWFIVLVEVLLLAIGLLAAFQVDRWWEDRAERAEERIYMSRLINNVEADIPHLHTLTEIQKLRLSYADLLIGVAANPGEAQEQPGDFLAAVIGASYTNYPTLRMHTFDDLRSTGNMALIQSGEVKAALYSYYEMDRQQANFRTLFLSNEFRHWELAAGILSPAQAKWLQDNRVFALTSNLELLHSTRFDPDEIQSAAERLAARQDLIDWLPQIREMQVYFVYSLERQTGLAEDVLELLRAYGDEIGARPDS